MGDLRVIQGMRYRALLFKFVKKNFKVAFSFYVHTFPGIVSPGSAFLK